LEGAYFLLGDKPSTLSFAQEALPMFLPHFIGNAPAAAGSRTASSSK
jgi:hypothetical protein